MISSKIIAKYSEKSIEINWNAVLECLRLTFPFIYLLGIPKSYWYFGKSKILIMQNFKIQVWLSSFNLNYFFINLKTNFSNISIKRGAILFRWPYIQNYQKNL